MVPKPSENKPQRGGAGCRRTPSVIDYVYVSTAAFLVGEPLISFETHDKLDAVFGVEFPGRFRSVFGFKGTAAAKIFEMNSLEDASAVDMTARPATQFCSKTGHSTDARNLAASLNSIIVNGGRGRNRTYNLSIKSRMLCQLSYASQRVC